MSGLFSPFTFGGLSVPNRIVVGPMDQYSATDGCAGDWHLMHYGRLAVSGAGLVMFESAFVERRARITRGCLGLYSDDNEYALRKVVDFCRRHGSAKLGLQISHAGRKGSTRIPTESEGGSRAPEYLRPVEAPWLTCSCTTQPRATGWPEPQALDADGLRQVVDAHADAARRAACLGFDALELVMAHGYLLHAFLSPLSNDRDDAYGGSPENRLRFPLQVFDAVRAAWGDGRPLLVRVSATDWVEGGWSPDDTIALCRRLKASGCSMITVSTGGLSLEQRVPLGEGHQVPFAEKIRAEAGIPTMATGMIFDPRLADSVIRDGKADLVAIARGMLVEPTWPWRAASVLGGEVEFPRQYVRGYRSRFHRNAAMAEW